MKWKRYTRGSARRTTEAGFTIVEFLVASVLGLLTVGLALAGTMAHRSVYFDDTVRTRVTQNLRSAVDILGLNVRQAGEALEASFPAVLLTNGNGGAPDELIIRRNRFENEILKICQTLTVGTSSPTILIGRTPNANANCRYDSLLSPYVATWADHVTEQGGLARAFAFNRSSRQGEFFSFTGMTDNGTEMSITRPSGTWQNAYPGDGLSAEMYVLEQFHYRVRNGVLQLIIDDDFSNILNVVDGITDFQVRINTASGPVETFAINDDWTGIQSIEVTLSGEESTAGERVIGSSITSRLFPRNVLSK